MKYPLPILFAILTALCWGLYGPTVTKARDTERPARWSPFKPYVFIGVAYLVLACGGGMVGMHFKGDSYSFAGDEKAAATWGFLAGALGALGSLTVTAAMLSFPIDVKPRQELVMPIVFGGAVTVSALVAAWQSRLAGVNPVMWLGIGLVIAGTVITAYFSPHGGPPHGTSPTAAHTKVHAPTDAAAVEPFGKYKSG